MGTPHATTTAELRPFALVRLRSAHCMRSTDGALWCDSRAVSGGGVINGGVTSDAVIGVGSSGWCGACGSEGGCSIAASDDSSCGGVASSERRGVDSLDAGRDTGLDAGCDAGCDDGCDGGNDDDGGEELRLEFVEEDETTPLPRAGPQPLAAL